MRMGRQLLSFEQALRWTADFASRRARTLAFDRPVPYLARVVLLAAVYFSAAKLALLAAIPPGYATAVWPPSGIAVASLLLLGTRIWPGIWLGASLVNITVQSSLVAATLMGAGNTLEALAGAALVRAFIGLPGPFRHGEDVVKFVAIAAASATIAATVAAAPLAFVHSLESPELLWNWWTWWQGDTVGIIIVTPLILGWAARARPAWTPRKIAEGSLLVCLLSGVMYAVFGAGMASYIPSLPLTFAILPFVIWAAFRFQQREVATVNALVCAMAVGFMLEGSGPFAQGSRAGGRGDAARPAGIARADDPRLADFPLQPPIPAGLSGTGADPRKARARTACAHHDGSRPVQADQRQRRPPGRRPGARASGCASETSRPRQRHRLPLWRRGVRGGASQDDARERTPQERGDLLGHQARGGTASRGHRFARGRAVSGPCDGRRGPPARGRLRPVRSEEGGAQPGQDLRRERRRRENGLVRAEMCIWHKTPVSGDGERGRSES